MMETRYLSAVRSGIRAALQRSAARSVFKTGMLSLLLAWFSTGCHPLPPLHPITLDSQTLTESQLLARQRSRIIEEVREKARRDVEKRKKELEAARKKTGKAVTLNSEDEFVVDVWLQDGITELGKFPYKGTVGPDGREFIPGVGQVQCYGRTVDEVGNEITEKLSRTLNRPIVNIRVTRHVGATVAIVGEVKMHSNRDSGPGVYPIKGATSLMDFIMAAGGYTDKADLHNIRVVYPDGRTETVDLERILAGDMRKNILLHGNETVYLPEMKKTGSVLVMGHVETPGVYGLRGDNRISRVLAEAGGVLRTGTRKRILLVRGDLYKPQVIRIDLDRVLKHGLKEEDVHLLNGDTIYVPFSHIAAFREFLSVVGLPISLARQFVFLQDDVLSNNSSNR